MDTAAYRADVVVRVEPGLRAKVREAGQRQTRRCPRMTSPGSFRSEAGDWYDAAELEEGRPGWPTIMRLALLNVPRGSADDSSVVVRSATENPPQQVSGEVGLISNGGLSGQVEWMHRSFMHGLRTSRCRRRRRPGCWHWSRRRSNAIGSRSPSSSRTHFGGSPGRRALRGVPGRLRDRSLAVGFDGTLVYATSPLRSISGVQSPTARCTTTGSATTSIRSNTCPCSVWPTPRTSALWATSSTAAR